jgi:hypothetical protein
MQRRGEKLETQYWCKAASFKNSNRRTLRKRKEELTSTIHSSKAQLAASSPTPISRLLRSSLNQSAASCLLPSFPNQ